MTENQVLVFLGAFFGGFGLLFLAVIWTWILFEDRRKERNRKAKREQEQSSGLHPA